MLQPGTQRASKLRFKTLKTLDLETVSVISAQTAQQSQWKVSLTLSIFTKDFLKKYFYIAISKNPSENQNRRLKIGENVLHG